MIQYTSPADYYATVLQTQAGPNLVELRPVALTHTNCCPGLAHKFLPDLIGTSQEHQCCSFSRIQSSHINNDL